MTTIKNVVLTDALGRPVATAAGQSQPQPLLIAEALKTILLKTSVDTMPDAKAGCRVTKALSAAKDTIELEDEDCDWVDMIIYLGAPKLFGFCAVTLQAAFRNREQSEAPTPPQAKTKPRGK